MSAHYCLQIFTESLAITMYSHKEKKNLFIYRLTSQLVIKMLVSSALLLSNSREPIRDLGHTSQSCPYFIVEGT